MDKDFLISEIALSDAESLREMLYLAIHVPEGETAPPDEIIYSPGLKPYWNEWGREGDLGFKCEARETGRTIGMAWLRLLSGDRKGYGWVDDAIPELSMAVVPDCRGKGIGSAMLDALLKQAEARFPAVSLSVSESNRAFDLYLRFGFEVLSIDEGAILMKKTLSQGRTA